MKEDKSSQNRHDLEVLAKLLDEQFQGPFGLRFGLDALIGLIPGIGDLVTSLVSSYILFRATSLKLPLPILLQMALNILIDQLIGTLPILGDFFDIYWKSNRKNVELISRYYKEDQWVPTSLYFNLSVVFVLISLLLFIPLYICYKILLLFL
jgi:hypothetical protein